MRLVWVVRGGRFYDCGFDRGCCHRPETAQEYPLWALWRAFMRSVQASRYLLCAQMGRGLRNKWVYRPRLELR